MTSLAYPRLALLGQGNMPETSITGFTGPAKVARLVLHFPFCLTCPIGNERQGIGMPSRAPWPCGAAVSSLDFLRSKPEFRLGLGVIWENENAIAKAYS